MESLEERDLFEIGQECLDQLETTIVEECDFVPLLKVILESSNGDDYSDVERNIYEKVLKYFREIEGENINFLKKRIMMILRRDGFDASLCKSSWCATIDYPGGEYEFIEITPKTPKLTASTRLILDIDFKSQFELARPTKTYTNLFNATPSFFIGTEQKLKKVITLLCSAMYRSFVANKLHVPPWRKLTYMQLKWLNCCNNVPIFPNSNVFNLGKQVKNRDQFKNETFF